MPACAVALTRPTPTVRRLLQAFLLHDDATRFHGTCCTDSSNGYPDVHTKALFFIMPLSSRYITTTTLNCGTYGSLQVADATTTTTRHHNTPTRHGRTLRSLRFLASPVLALFFPGACGRGGVQPQQANASHTKASTGLSNFDQSSIQPKETDSVLFLRISLGSSEGSGYVFSIFDFDVTASLADEWQLVGHN